MTTWWKHLHRRDLQFIALVCVNLACVAGFLFAEFETGQQPAGGWRRIDLPAVLNRIESGDLHRHEAQWYHRAKTETGGEAP